METDFLDECRKLLPPDEWSCFYHSEEGDCLGFKLYKIHPSIGYVNVLCRSSGEYSYYYELLHSQNGIFEGSLEDILRELRRDLDHLLGAAKVISEALQPFQR